MAESPALPAESSPGRDAPGHAPGAPLVEAQGLTKSYGGFVAVRGVSFRVTAGQAVGFVGPNGAGKTTTFRMLSGSLGPTAGRVRICGIDLSEEPLEAKRRIGYMPEAPPLYPELTTEEYLRYRAGLKGVPRKERKKQLDGAAERARVTDVLHTPIGHLSKGYRQRVALADALLGDPPVLLLDEPTAGLDPNQVLEVRALIRELAKERTIFLSTHVLSEVEATCDRALVIHQGALVAEGTLDELRAQASAQSARLVLRDPEGRAARLLREGGFVVQTDDAPRGAREGAPKSAENAGKDAAAAAITRLRVLARDASERGATASDGDVELLVEEAVALLTSAGIGVREAAPERAALDVVFQALTRGAKEEDAP